MTTLSDIRDLETRLHSHFLEWDDTPLQNELLWMLDEMQLLHEKLDFCDVPNNNPDGLDMTLAQRLDWLVTRYVRGIIESPKDAYGKPLALEPKQLRML